MLERRRSYVTSLIIAFVLGACAEGAKLESELGSRETGAGAGGQPSDGAGGFAKAGATSYVPSNGGLSFYGTKASTRTGVSGGTDGGSGAGGASGGLPQTGGGATGAVSNIVAPTSGLAVALVELTDSDGTGSVVMRLSLVNFGPEAVPLSAVWIRYFFTQDAPAELRFESYYASQPTTIEAKIVAIDATEADRYLQLSFAGGTLMVGEANALKLNARLYDSTWKTKLVGSNDYSYVPLVGFCDRITAYRDGRLDWGTEPRILGGPYDGAGGNSGAGGATWGNTAGGSFGAGGSGGASATGGTGNVTSSAGGNFGSAGGTRADTSVSALSAPSLTSP